MTAPRLYPHDVSLRHRRILWMLSQGAGFPEIALDLGTTAPSVKQSCVVFYARFDVRGRTHAVAWAIHNGIIGPYEDCGTRAAYLAHQERDEYACPACRNANTAWVEAEATRCAPLPEGLRPEHIQLLRALDAGRSLIQITDLWHVSRTKLERTVTETYAALGVTHLPRPRRRAAALTEARRLGALQQRRATARPLPAHGKTRPLSPVERKVLITLADGRSIASAGTELGMLRTSVSSRLSLVYRKLDVAHLPVKERRAAALAKARQNGDLG